MDTKVRVSSKQNTEDKDELVDAKTNVYVDGKTGARTHQVTKTLKLPGPDSSTNITQTTTITRTTTCSHHDDLNLIEANQHFNLPNLRAFFDFEKLAKDISEVNNLIHL